MAAEQKSSWNGDLTNIAYKKNVPLEPRQILEVYASAPLSPRCDYPEERISAMYRSSNLILSAWDGDKLIGVARSLTDYAYCTYCSDLAIRKEYQKGGIGKELLRRTKEAAGDASNLLLLAADEAMGYYPKIGFEKVDNAFLVKRKEWFVNLRIRSLL